VMTSKVSTSSLLKVISESKVEYRDQFDALAFAIHATIVGWSLELVGLQEKAEEKALDLAPQDWNASSDLYCFVYRSKDKKIKIILKAVRMGDILLIHAAVADKVYSLEFRVDDYIDIKVSLSQHDKLYKNMDRLLSILDRQFLSQICPPAPVPAATTERKNSLRDDRTVDPLLDTRFPGRRPMPLPHGDFDDDLYGPFPGVPGSIIAPFGGDGGNLMGPNHPVFGGGITIPGGRGGRGMNPRFDPYGPLPGLGEPDANHLPPPGRRPDGPDPFL